jgi:4-amino-4-deoxy-L-arabinose transferase-like glycosyltransferase
VLVCIVGIYRRIFKDFPTAGAILGLAAAVLYVFNPLVDYANGYAWNHDVVILCVVLSFWIFISADFQLKSRYWKIAAMSGLLTFATWMRVTGVLVELLFLVMLLVQPAQSARQRVKTILPFLIAAAGVSVWPVWVIAQAQRAFFLNIVRIPALYGEWLKRIGMVHNKFGLTLNSITTPGYLVLIVVAVYLCIVVMHLRQRLKITDGKNLLLAALLPVTFFIIAFIPPTMWEQYLAMPVPFLVIGLAYPLLYLRGLANKDGQNKQFKIAAALVIVCVFIAVASSPTVAVRTVMLFEPESWTPVQLHRISQDIAQRTKEPKLALTLAPLFALEGGCNIYTELSAGSIIYRVGDFMTAQELAITHTVGPKTLGELVEKSPPAVVIVGVEMEFLEEHLFKTAVKPDWERKVYENGVTAYFRP